MFNFDIFFEKLRHGEVYFDDFPDERLLRFKDKTFPLLIESIKEKDENKLSLVLSILFYDGADSDYTEVLIGVLNADWHFLKEDIVEILEIIKDPRSIKSLYNLIIEDLKDDEDEMRSLAKKCIYALSSINTSESIEILNKLTEMDDQIIRNKASVLLKKSK